MLVQGLCLPIAGVYCPWLYGFFITLHKLCFILHYCIILVMPNIVCIIDKHFCNAKYYVVSLMFLQILIDVFYLYVIFFTKKAMLYQVL